MVKSSETLAILGNGSEPRDFVTPKHFSQSSYVRVREHELEVLEAELKKEKVANNQQRAELEALKPELEKEKATNTQLWAENTQLRTELEALKSEEAEIAWLRLELKRERSVSNALSVMITTVHKT